MKTSRDGLYIIQFYAVGGIELSREVLEIIDEDLARIETELTRVLGDYFGVQQWEWDALVSLSFNDGAERLRGSELIRHLQADRVERAADRFLDYAGALPFQVFTKRRLAERALFLGHDYRPLLVP